MYNEVHDIESHDVDKMRRIYNTIQRENIFQKLDKEFK